MYTSTILNTYGHSGHDFSSKWVGCWSYNISVLSEDFNVSPSGQNLLIPSCSNSDSRELAPWLCCWHGALRHEAIDRQREKNVQCFLLQGVISVTFTASLQLSWKLCKTNLFEAKYFSEHSSPDYFKTSLKQNPVSSPLRSMCTHMYLLIYFLLWFCSKGPCSFPKETSITVERQSVSQQGLVMLPKTFLGDSRTFRGKDTNSHIAHEGLA